MLHISLVKMKVPVYYILLLTCIGQLNCYYQGSEKIENCRITPLTLRPCEDTEATSEFNGIIFNLNDNEEKALNFTAVVNEEVTDEFKVFVKIDKWTNGAWEEDVFEGDGLVWEYVEKFAAKAWKKVREKSIPTISQEYALDTGSYEVALLQLKPDDFSVPVSMFGKFKVRMIIQNPENEVFFCHWLEVAIDRP